MAPKPELDISIAVENGVPLDHVPPLEQSVPSKTPEAKRPWYRRTRVLYTVVAVLLLISIGLATFAILWATDIIELGGENVEATAAGTGSDTTQGEPEAPATEAPAPSADNEDSPTTEPSTPTNDQDVATPEPTAALPQSSPLPTALPTALATEVTRTDPVSFYVMGDIPYAEWEEVMLGTQMGEMTASLHPGALFTVHVGDMQTAVRTSCTLDRFNQVANILATGPLPTFVQVGDNDYLDCPDKSAAWDNYIQTFVGFEDNWLHTLAVERWTELMNVPMEYNMTRQVAKSEMFALVEDGILFISFTLLNMDLGDDEPPDDLFYERLADSKAWVTKHLNETQNLRGVVMFSHAMVTGDIRPFFEELRDVFFNAGVYTPVLYIHGDGHDFSINTDFGNNLAWPQITRIGVDQGGYADPLLITVAQGAEDGYFQPLTADDSGLQFAVSNGLFLVDRQNGRYPDSNN